MRKTFFLLSCLLSGSSMITVAQLKQDSVLREVTVEAYYAGRPALEVPASIGYLSNDDLQRFSNTSLLPAVNTIPGVRMEERSPGSYRFAIRGSSIRSPFGVRNVKMYWNGLPLTDGGGNTYLNLIDFDAIGSAEIIKGPGGSLYGAGTGGVILLNTPAINKDKLQFSALGGSYGLQRYQLTEQGGNEKINHRILVAHQRSDGYREQTATKRTSINSDLNIRLGEGSVLSPSLFYTDLFYETPGALTLAQYNEDPRQARPGTPATPGAVEQQAAVFNKTFYGGLTHDQQWNAQWTSQAGVYMSVVDFKNPTIRNYEKRKEKNFGARTQTGYKHEASDWKGTFSLGAEFQYFTSGTDVLQNNLGNPGDLTTQDDLTSKLFFIFGQADFELAHDFFVTLGGSVNFLKFGFERMVPNADKGVRKFDPVFSPRIAVLKKINDVSVYGSLSQGFSPPTIAELYPSRQIFQTDLNAERGTNVEVGVKGDLFQNKIAFDITVYQFQLDETIVIRRDTSLPGEPEYFVNAGKTQQRGIEGALTWNIIRKANDNEPALKIWTSYSYNHYRFKDYIQDANDLSGNKLTGVPPTIVNLGLDITGVKNFYTNVTANYVDHIPVNDANSAYANEYLLIGARVGYHAALATKHQLEIFAGIDNALDKKYSLGNDLNAVGNRYYNVAAARNFYAGLKLDLSFKE